MKLNSTIKSEHFSTIYFCIIKRWKNLYTLILKFLEEFNEHNDNEFKNESFDEIINVIKSQLIEDDVEEMRQFLKIIKNIGEHHRRDQHFNERMSQLLLYYKDEIKHILSNSEIFHIFENNKKIVHFLLQEDIITISDEIYPEMMSKYEYNGNRYCHFFIPELENFIGEDKMLSVKNELLKNDPNFFNNYEEKRQEGENDSYICSLIRQDSVEEFIKYVNRYNISPLGEISPSIFETNPFLISNKNTTLIEYSAFFGSIQIFQYLLMNEAELTPSLWLYAIHSKNAELIHLLESNEVPPPKSKCKEEFEQKVDEEEKEESNEYKNYVQCLIESIKCHHNDIADYIENNFIDKMMKYKQQNEEIISNCIKYHNYAHLQIDEIIDHGFFYIYFCHYDKLFELLLKKKENSIVKKMKQCPNISIASQNKDVEVIYHYLLKMHEIPENLFNGAKITQIAIPSSITSIGDYSFYGCSSLMHIAIPSSVTKIGNFAFSGCSSLTQITIPSSVTSIGEDAFNACSSLTQITIPSSVTSIGDYAFGRCPLLDNLSIIPSRNERIEFHNNQFLLNKSNPNSEIYDIFIWAKPTVKVVKMPTFITSIGNGSFFECSSLTQITIPSSVTSIGEYVFYECSSLTQISIPSSVTKIGNNAFKECISLKQVTFEIPSSITSIGEGVFNECSSLEQITIPSSVTSIGNDAFQMCYLLTQILFETPSSLNSIGLGAFSECSSLTQISIPSSVTSIEFDALSRCSSLTQIAIPSSVKSIKDYAFYECSSLKQIIFEIPFSVTSIDEAAFAGCSSLTQITIPSSVTSIGDGAFATCSSLTQVTFETPSSVTKIGEGAFSNCSSLTQITIPSSVNSIGNGAFEGCSSLKLITISSSIDTNYLGIDQKTIINTVNTNSI